MRSHGAIFKFGEMSFSNYSAHRGSAYFMEAHIVLNILNYSLVEVIVWLPRVSSIVNLLTIFIQNRAKFLRIEQARIIANVKQYHQQQHVITLHVHNSFLSRDHVVHLIGWVHDPERTRRFTREKPAAICRCMVNRQTIRM
jgi:hypothetical protein